MAVVKCGGSNAIVILDTEPLRCELGHERPRYMAEWV